MTRANGGAFLNPAPSAPAAASNAGRAPSPATGQGEDGTGSSQGEQNGARNGRGVERAGEMRGRADGWAPQPVILGLDPSIGAGRRRAGPGGALGT